MTNQSMFIKETQNQIKSLGATTVKLTLMSIRAPILPLPILERAIESVADPLDVVGPLGDSSLGLLSVWSAWPHGDVDVKRRYIPRLQSVLAPLARHREIGIVHVRAVTHWASEMTNAYDLLDSLFDSPSVALALPKPQASFQIGPTPFSWYAPEDPRGVRA